MSWDSGPVCQEHCCITWLIDSVFWQLPLHCPLVCTAERQSLDCAFSAEPPWRSLGPTIGWVDGQSNGGWPDLRRLVVSQRSNYRLVYFPSTSDSDECLLSSSSMMMLKRMGLIGSLCRTPLSIGTGSVKVIVHFNSCSRIRVFAIVPSVEVKPLWLRLRCGRFRSLMAVSMMQPLDWGGNRDGSSVRRVGFVTRLVYQYWPHLFEAGRDDTQHHQYVEEGG